MDIPVHAAVRCSDGSVGRSTYVVVNPVAEHVTHIVVKEMQPPHVERLVPAMFVKATTPKQIELSCTRDQLGRLRPFVQTEFVRVRAPLLELADLTYRGDEDVMSLPYTRMELSQAVGETTRGVIAQRFKAVPLGELAVHRGARVQATDGRVGRVDEFIVDPESMHITHLTMRKGHLWGEKEISIPVSEIERIAENVVHLKLDRRRIEALPAIKVRRSWE
jgi:uncharacterized protein YwbE